MLWLDLERCIARNKGRKVSMERNINTLLKTLGVDMKSVIYFRFRLHSLGNFVG